MKKLIFLFFLLTEVSFGQVITRSWDLKATTVSNACGDDATKTCTPPENIGNRGLSSHIFTWSLQSGVVSSCTLSFQTSPDNKSTSTWTEQTTGDCSATGTTSYLSFATNFIRIKLKTISVTSGTLNVTVNYAGYVNNPATNPTSITPTTINSVQYCNNYTGSSASIRIANCVAALSTVGGTADARGIQGAQGWSTDAFSGITYPVDLILGATTYTVAATSTIPANVTIWRGPGTTFSINNGITFNILGSIKGPGTLTFSGSGTVCVSLQCASGPSVPFHEIVEGYTSGFFSPGIGPAPSTATIGVDDYVNDSTAGNHSSILGVATNSGTRYTAGVTGIGFIPTGSGGGGNVWGGQFTARANGTGAGTLIGANIETDMPGQAAGSSGIVIEDVCGKSGADTNLTPCHSGIQFFNSQYSPFDALIRIADTNGYSPISAGGSIITGDGGGGVSATYGINLKNMTFSTAAFTSTNFVVDGSGNEAVGKSTAPGQTLEVSSGTTNKTRLRFTNTTTTASNQSGFEFFASASFKGGLFKDESSDVITLWDATGARLTLNQAGTVSITPSGSNAVVTNTTSSDYTCVFCTLGSISSVSAATNAQVLTFTASGSDTNAQIVSTKTNSGTTKKLEFFTDSDEKAVFNTGTGADAVCLRFASGMRKLSISGSNIIDGGACAF